MAGNDSIQGHTWTVHQLFSGRRYRLDSYQREYAWGKEQVEELIVDLTSRFRKEWTPQHELRDIARYQPYFLGPIITSIREDGRFLIDGQQRLTTLMLLLMWLMRTQEGRDDAVSNLGPLVYSEYLGDRSFAVDDEERTACLTALLNGTEIDLNGASVSVRNLVRCFQDIDQLFPEDLRDDELPFFINWLLERVTLVEVSTQSDSLALEIFESMNDRGLRLTSVDMLKSFLLAQVSVEDRDKVNSVWRARLTELADIDSNAHSSFIKGWLRSKYSTGPEDDDQIGTAFDKWLRKEAMNVGLVTPTAFRSFVLSDMDVMASRYRQLLVASRVLRRGLEAVFFNAHNSVTLQLPLILAAANVDDDDATFQRKAQMVAGYLDIFVSRSMVNAHDFRYASVDRRLFALARDIRGLDADALSKRLSTEVAAIPYGFEGMDTFALRPRNRAYVKYLLARMASWLDARCGTGHDFGFYTRNNKDQQPFEIEHIWADKFKYQPQLPRRMFSDLRNRFGGLVLLPKDINASFGDLPYEKKIEKYLTQNLLTRSLHPLCYQNNPSFLRLIKEHDLPFRPYADSFDQHAIHERQRLYRRLADVVWNPTQFGLAIEAAPAGDGRDRRTYFDVTLARLVESQVIPSGSRLLGTYRGAEHRAVITPDGRIQIDTGEQFDAPSPAAMAVLDKQSWNGWSFWPDLGHPQPFLGSESR